MLKSKINQIIAQLFNHISDKNDSIDLFIKNKVNFEISVYKYLGLNKKDRLSDIKAQESKIINIRYNDILLIQKKRSHDRLWVHSTNVGRRANFFTAKNFGVEAGRKRFQVLIYEGKIYLYDNYSKHGIISSKRTTITLILIMIRKVLPLEKRYNSCFWTGWDSGVNPCVKQSRGSCRLRFSRSKKFAVADKKQNKCSGSMEKYAQCPCLGTICK